jgi:carbonic anhydrase/acetyltransferase-like protein (isoleucine patch superfamily)
MPTILPFRHHTPVIADDAWIADTAVIIGDVRIEAGASIWFGAGLRGDVGPIRIGARTNVQDLCCVHTTGGLSEAILEQDVTVGHGCILHGCRIGARVLVGMGSILLDNAEIGEDSVIGAGSLVTSRTMIPPRSLVMGRPARVIREAREHEMRLGPDGAACYAALVEAYRPRPA